MLATVIVAAVVLIVWAGPKIWTQYHIHCARSALKTRDVDAALAHLRHAERLTVHSPERHFLLARAYRRQGRLELMRDHLARAWKLGYPVESLQREQWLAMAQAGQLEEAEPHLTRLLKNVGEDGPEICEAYVNGYFRTYRFHKAFALLDAWQADFPDDPQPHVFRGIYSQHQKHFLPDGTGKKRRSPRVVLERARRCSGPVRCRSRDWQAATRGSTSPRGS